MVVNVTAQAVEAQESEHEEEIEHLSIRVEESESFGSYELVHADAFTWLDRAPANSIHAVVTDPPYGLMEYTPDQLAKLRKGRGGVWRIPPSFDGHRRQPLPRFTVLTDDDKANLRRFFKRLADALLLVLVPGAHVFIATNPLVSDLVYEPFVGAGFEKRGEIVRVVYTLRGGDRPKGAHDEFSDVSVMPKSCWEPWGLFRKPCDGRVRDNLRIWKTGGLRRISPTEPFKDLIYAAPARGAEREAARHPSLKPQALMRQLTRAALPLGEGVILDPFMGSGATIAAASTLGLRSVGIEIDRDYFNLAIRAVPVLARLPLTEAKNAPEKIERKGRLSSPRYRAQQRQTGISERRGNVEVRRVTSEESKD